MSGTGSSLVGVVGRFRATVLRRVLLVALKLLLQNLEGSCRELVAALRRRVDVVLIRGILGHLGLYESTRFAFAREALVGGGSWKRSLYPSLEANSLWEGRCDHL